MNFSDCWSRQRPRPRPCLANVTPESARLTTIASAKVINAKRNVFSLNIEFSLFEIQNWGRLLRRMERVPNRHIQFLCYSLKNSSRFRPGYIELFDQSG